MIGTNDKAELLSDFCRMYRDILPGVPKTYKAMWGYVRHGKENRAGVRVKLQSTQLPAGMATTVRDWTAFLQALNW